MSVSTDNDRGDHRGHSRRSRRRAERLDAGHGDHPSPQAAAPATVTNPHKPSHRELTPKHHEAIELLIQGRTDAEVATQIGTTRETVNRWRHWHPPFMAELNRRRLDVWRATRERLRFLGARALDVLEQQLQAGNAKVALALLRHVQEEKVPHGSTEIEDVITDIVQQRDLALLAAQLGPRQDHPMLQRMRTVWIGPADAASGVATDAPSPAEGR